MEEIHSTSSGPAEHHDGSNPTGNPSSKPEVKKSDPFALFGKIAAIVLVLAILVGGGIYLGMNMTNGTSQTQDKMVPPTEPTAAISNDESPTPSATDAVKKVTGGMTNDSTVFKQYTVEIPTGWTEKSEKTDITDTLTLTKNDISIKIYQAPMGGGGCSYPGDPEQMMSQKYTDYITVNGPSGNFRLSYNKAGNPVTYTVCESTNGTTYGNPTSYGAITVKGPDPIDAATMTEIKGILSSLKKI